MDVNYSPANDVYDTQFEYQMYDQQVQDSGTYENYTPVPVFPLNVNQPAGKISASMGDVNYTPKLKDINALVRSVDGDLEKLSADQIKTIDFKNANLAGCLISRKKKKQFNGVDMSGADFRYANFLSNASHAGNFQYADFSGAILRNARFQGCSLSDADFTGCDLSRADLRNTFGYNTKLKGAKIESADMRDAIFKSCRGVSSILSVINVQISRSTKLNGGFFGKTIF